MIDIEILRWGGGILVAALTAFVGMRAERWKAQREERSAEKEAQREEKSAERDKDAEAWNRVKETIADMRKEIQDLRTELAESEKRSDTATHECDKRVAAVRQEVDDELTQTRSRMMAMSKLCYTQQLDLDAQGIELSRMRRSKAENEHEGTPTQRLAVPVAATYGSAP